MSIASVLLLDGSVRSRETDGLRREGGEAGAEAEGAAALDEFDDLSIDVPPSMGGIEMEGSDVEASLPNERAPAPYLSGGLTPAAGTLSGAFSKRGGPRSLRNGAGSSANDAIDDALKWLQAHQSADGGWECEGFPAWCDGKRISWTGPTGVGKPQYDVGVTGLALLAFLGAGYTNRSDHAFGKVVANGLKHLRNAQDAEGCFGSRSNSHFVYNHAIAAIAMVEAYGMTGSTMLKHPAQKALDFLSISNRRYFAGRDGMKLGDHDTLIIGWTSLTLLSANLINKAEADAFRKPSLTFDEDVIEGIRAWVEKEADPELVDPSSDPRSELRTAVGTLARIVLGEDLTSDAITKGASHCAKFPPKWDPNDGSIDMDCWHFGTLAMYQVGGKPWDTWERGLKSAVVDTQRRDTDYCMYRVSWDPIDAWGPDGGRVYSTACLALCLQVWYRYPKRSGSAAGR